MADSRSRRVSLSFPPATTPLVPIPFSPLLSHFTIRPYPTVIPASSDGDDLWGSRRLRAALAHFYTSFFHPARPVDSSHLIVGAGCSAILDQLFHVLLDPGEGILLSKPYYSGFDRDLRPRSGAVLVGVPLDEGGRGGEGSVEERFGKALKEQREKGVKVKAMIVCNPQNPRGFTCASGRRNIELKRGGCGRGGMGVVGREGSGGERSAR